MVRLHRLLSACRIAGGFAVTIALPALSVAQTFVPERGEGSVSFQYQNALVTDHYLTSTRVDIGHIQSQVFVLDATYGVTDRLAVRFTVPEANAKYSGHNAHTDPFVDTKYDNGRYHGAVADLHFDARFALTPGRVLEVTPFVEVIVPSHDYVYFAHSAPGQDLRETQVGAYIGRTLDPIAPNLFVQARLGYGFVERVVGYYRDRRYADVEMSYMLKPGVRVILSGTSMFTHGGIDFVPTMTKQDLLDRSKAEGFLEDELWTHHDQLGHEDFANIGLGASVVLTPSIDVFGSVATNVFDRNGHSIRHAVAIGITWHFSQSDPLKDLRGGTTQQMVARCVCN